jgi:hypothetical protein
MLDCSVNARELEGIERRLAHKRLRAREAALTAAGCTCVAAAIAPFALTGALPMLVGGAVAALLSLANLTSRRNTIARLALDPNAYALDDVRRYGNALIRLTERQRLAAWLRDVIREAQAPGSWYLVDRVARHAGQLELLAAEIAAPSASVRPSSAAACRRLLTHAAESPLYNYDVPAEELPAIIERIRWGITA